MRMLAIDLGASSGRGIVGEIDPAGGRLALREVHRFDNRFTEKSGRRIWDAAGLMRGVTESIRAAGAAGAARGIQSVGIDTWGVDYGYVDSSGGLVGDLIAYRDPRTERAVEFVHGRIPPERLYSLTGTQHMAINTLFQVADDLSRRPGVLERAERLLMMPDLLAHALTGVGAAEYTIASTTGMLDARSRDWSDEIVGSIGFPRRLLPRPVMPGEARSPLKAELARELGVCGEVIRVGSHDTASAVAAVPAEGEDWAYVSSGTWSLVGCELMEPILTGAARRKNFTNEGGVGGTIRFLRNVSGLWIIQELRRLWRELYHRELGWDDIVREAEAAPAHAAFINPDSPRFVAPADMREAVAECCRASGQRPPEGVGPTARCVYESLAFAYRRALDDMAGVTGKRPSRVHVVGGGSQNRFLCRLTAEATGLPVLAGPSEATAIGNIIVQAMARGLLRDLAAGRKLVRASFEPELFEPELYGRTDAAYAAFLAVR